MLSPVMMFSALRSPPIFHPHSPSVGSVLTGVLAVVVVAVIRWPLVVVAKVGVVVVVVGVVVTVVVGGVREKRVRFRGGRAPGLSNANWGVVAVGVSILLMLPMLLM